MKDLFYLCDRRACRNCSYPQCKHSTDISHAKHFVKGLDDSYWEEPIPILLLESDCLLNPNDLQKIKESILEQISEGFIIVPNGFKPKIITTEDQDVWEISIKPLNERRGMA